MRRPPSAVPTAPPTMKANATSDIAAAARRRSANCVAVVSSDEWANMKPSPSSSTPVADAGQLRGAERDHEGLPRPLAQSPRATSLLRPMRSATRADARLAAITPTPNIAISRPMPSVP